MSSGADRFREVGNEEVRVASARPELMEIYRRLLDEYGPQGWWPASSPFEMIAGAILTQAAAWRNVERALDNLRSAGVQSWAEVHALPPGDLAELVRPSGYYNAKARKLKAFAAHVCEVHDGDLDGMFAGDTESVRRELLGIHGIGPETADDILVYAAGKPSFVIDAYTIRILRRVGMEAIDGDNYDGWQRLFHCNLPRDVSMFNEYHALFDHHHKAACTKNAPRCGGCCLLDICAHGAAAVGAPAVL